MAELRRPPLTDERALLDWLDKAVVNAVNQLNTERIQAALSAEEQARRYALVVSN